MKSNIEDFPEFMHAVQNDGLVYLFGAGISSALTDNKACGWWQWICNGTSYIKDERLAETLRSSMADDGSTDNLIRIAGEVIKAAKADGTYHDWMKASYESASVSNMSLAETLKKLLIPQDVFATTNYDMLLEKATGLSTLTYEEPDKAFGMLDRKRSESVLHIHGAYDSSRGLDNIVADSKQYEAVLNDKGAQFVQQILGTRTLIFVGCGKTTEDGNISQFIDFAGKYLKMEKSYYFLHKSDIVPSGMPDNVVPVPYGDDYNDLPLFLEDIALVRLRKLMEKNPIVGRTIYDEKNDGTDTFQKYHYAQESIAFCGREEELDELLSFVNADTDFSWWTVTGQAGAGKSRLAYELLRHLPLSWFGFFISDAFYEKDIETFSPFSDTVVIIDYVSGRETLAADWIKKLRERFAAVPYRLRILLLERDNNRKTGSWFAKLVHRFGKYDDALAHEYRDCFLDLTDLDDGAVLKFIGAVCCGKGLANDPDRDQQLMDIYREKHENLRFRPLYIQIFVEAWILNGFSFPRYDRFEEILEIVLSKEQEKWLASLDGDQNVCNALIHLLLRGNVEAIRTDSIPEYYKKDWEIVSSYIAMHSFPGRQRMEGQRSIINAVCHNMDQDNYHIAPLFPDIIKEYMFSYYMESERLDDVMREIWENAAHSFSLFIARCLTDFPENDFYNRALNAYQKSTGNKEYLIGRLELLRGRKLSRSDDPMVLFGIVENEHEFWKSIALEKEDSDFEVLSLLKVAGLNFVAKAYGGWSMFDVSNMMEAIDEALEVQGGEAAEAMKQFFLQDHIASLAQASFADEAAYLRKRMSALIEESEDSELNCLYNMQNLNSEMMEWILNRNFKKAYQTLCRMERQCDYKEKEAVRMLAHSCFNMDHLAFGAGELRYVGKGYDIAEKLELRYPEDTAIRSRSLACQASVLQKKFFAEQVEKDIFACELKQLEEKLNTMDFGVDEQENEALEFAWGMLKTLKLNATDDEDEVRELIAEANAVLKERPYLTEVVQTKIFATQALHERFLNNKISHAEVEELFRYVELNYTSGAVRNAFFEMLKDSEDAGKDDDFMTENVLFGARQDARYNPLMGSGIPKIDLEAELLREMSELEPAEPYVRPYRKVGANDPCPCGSGKKFKRCCKGKGKYV